MAVMSYHSALNQHSNATYGPCRSAGGLRWLWLKRKQTKLPGRFPRTAAGSPTVPTNPARVKFTFNHSAPPRELTLRRAATGRFPETDPREWRAGAGMGKS